jgi:hypothetical protein
MKTKYCVQCRKPYQGTGTAQRWCPACQPLRNKERRYLSRRAYNRHGISTEQYDAWVGAGCAVCGNPFTETPHTDHDHTHCADRRGCEYCVWGRLCKPCNVAFIYAIELNPALRNLVAPKVLKYIDKIREKQGCSSLAKASAV